MEQFVQGQIEPSMENLRMYQMSREQFREGLLLLKVDENGQKQQQEVQLVTEASNNEVAKDKRGVSLEEDAKSPKAGTELAEEHAPDQCIEAATKVLAGEESTTTSNSNYMLDRQRKEDTRNVCHASTKTASTKIVFPNTEEMAHQKEQLEEAQRQAQKRKQA